MKQEKIHASELNPEVYESASYSKLKYFFLGFFIIFVGFILNFPFKQSLEGLMVKALQSNPRCQIGYKNLNFSLFFPKIHLSGANVPGTCFGQAGKSLSFDTFAINFSGPNFYPPGLKLHVQATKGNSLFHIYPTISFSRSVVKIEDTKVDMDFLSPLLPLPNLLRGSVKIDSLIGLRQQSLRDAQFLIESQDLVINPQTISGFEIPFMKLGQFSFKGDLDAQHILTVHNLIIGDEEAPIVANFSGQIKISPINFSYSNVDLLGEVKFTKKFLEDFPILNLMIGSKKPDDRGFYRLKLSGPINNLPSPQFL